MSLRRRVRGCACRVSQKSLQRIAGNNKNRQLEPLSTENRNEFLGGPLNLHAPIRRRDDNDDSRHRSVLPSDTVILRESPFRSGFREWPSSVASFFSGS